jgi:3-dehydroquinate synthase
MVSERLLKVSRMEAATWIAVQPGSIARLGETLRGRLKAPQTLLVSDVTVDALYGRSALQSLRAAGFSASAFTVAPGETSKAMASLERLYDHLAGINLGRDGLILALGGGVVSDLAGFAAASWMRGVPWAACPTTLEAMIDASVGGKTAVNVPGGKNLVGAFHHPVAVIIDPDCLATLSERDLRAGLAESVKHAAVFSPEFFAWHEQNADAILRREPAVIAQLIERNVAIKADVVAKDAAEQSGLRMLLNFGHTLGHAIEECCGFALRHGECVALGMTAASRLSQALGLLDSSAADRITHLLATMQLPTCLPAGSSASSSGAGVAGLEWRQIQEVMGRDKKAREGRLQFVLLQDIGRPAIRGDIEEAEVRRAFESLLRKSG